jgi:hypothetical protein
MTPDRQQLVLDSWKNVEPNATRLVELAVLRLVEIAPQAAPLVPNARMPAICRSVAEVIGRIVAVLDEPKQFVPLTIGLGRTNLDHGIPARLYPAMGEALVWALQLQLGDALTPELQAAWLECHHLVSAIMRRGEQSRTGEFERYRTGEYAAFQNMAVQEVRASG